jgi:transcription antitermination protein NusB
VKGRRVARQIALDVLYEAEIREMLPIEAFRTRQTEGWANPSDADTGTDLEEPAADSVAYARVLVEGVQEQHATLDALIVKYADHWTIERMPVIDRNLIRLALFELLCRDDVPVAVAINEVVELAKSLSTDDSGRFINGLLGKIVEKEGVA